jgi:two-component system, sensor histidine kinase and response regulator
MADNSSRDANSSLGPASGQNAKPVFDRAVALERLGGSVELFQQLIVMYGEDAPRLWDELRSGAAQGDVEQLKRAAHTLKGLAANFEAKPAAEAAFRVEQLAQRGDLAAAVENVPEMESQFERLQLALDRQIASAS